MKINVSQKVLDAKRSNEANLLSYPNVQTVGAGHKNDTTEECIIVGVTEKVPENQLSDDEIIPSQIDGVKTDVQEVGEIVPELLEPLLDRKSRHRPVPQGVSIGHPNITAGSTGWMYESQDGTTYIGSNNHVLANSNNASDGDSQLQPGPADGGGSGDEVGTLAHYIPIENRVDVDLAIATANANIENGLVGVDKPITGVVENLSIGDELVKSGRTTGVQRNTIQQLDASVNVNYGSNLGTVTITGCIITGNMSDGGDSGSSTAKEVNGGLRAAGRVFAGSSSVTVHHHIDNEIRHLNNFDSSIALITDGGTDRPTASVELTLTEKSGEGNRGDIETTVRDDSGNPLENADVDVSGPVSASKKTDSKGFAAFRDLPIDAYSIVATKEGYEEDSVDITDNDFQ